MSQSIVTPVGRVSFPNLHKMNQYGKYGITLLLAKNDPKVQEFVQWLQQAVTSEARAHAGDHGFNAAMAEFKAFRDGDQPAAFKTYRNEYAGHWVVSMTRQPDFGKPSTVNRNRQPIDPNEVYAGCDAIVYMDVFGYTFGSKKSVSLGFQHVMKVNENTRFASTGVEADEAFGDLDLPPENPNAGVPAHPFGQPTPAPSPYQQPVPAPQAPAASAPSPYSHGTAAPAPAPGGWPSAPAPQAPQAPQAPGGFPGMSQPQAPQAPAAPHNPFGSV